MSVLSLLTSVALIGLVYGLSFLPNATLTRPDDGFGVVEDASAPDEPDAGRDKPQA